MKYDIVIAGIGGQGVVTAAKILAAAARRTGLHVVQSKLQRAMQRGGAIAVHLRIGSTEPQEETIPPGQADLILALEPLESTRYLELLSTAGTVVSATEPIPNVAHYPDLDDLLLGVLKLPNGFVVDATTIAVQAGGSRAASTALLGAAAAFVPLEASDLREAIGEVLGPKGTQVVTVNLAAFEGGRASLRHRELVDEFDTFAVLSH